MGWLDPEELRQLLPAETSAFPSPIPTQSVSSDEFMPAPQTKKQREFEARVKEYGAALARQQGVSRRAFFKTAAGMAAAFVAMNETYGRLYAVSRAEAATPEMANARLYKYPIKQKAELARDRFAQCRGIYEQAGADRSNRACGYIRQRVT